jgi:hypothetical protein
LTHELDPYGTTAHLTDLEVNVRLPHSLWHVQHRLADGQLVQPTSTTNLSQHHLKLSKPAAAVAGAAAAAAAAAAE